MQHWKTALEQKYTAIPGITEMHDISVSKLRLGKTTVTQRRVCCNGEYTALRKYKYNAEQTLPDISSYEPVVLSAEKIRQLGEQHRRYIKQDVPHYKIPAFSRLRIPQWLRQLIFLIHRRKRRGSVLTLAAMGRDMWTQQGSVISEKNCPQAAKKPRN